MLDLGTLDRDAKRKTLALHLHLAARLDVGIEQRAKCELGFAALENALFVYNPLVSGDFMNSALTGSFRFLGATLLHILASGTIGVFLALTYYKTRLTQLTAGTFGLFIAIVLHALFNFFIMDASGETILGVFLFVWMGVIVLFLLFEKIKQLECAHNPTSCPIV